MSADPGERRPTSAEPVVLAPRDGLVVTVIPAHGARIAQITDSRGNDWLAATGAQELPDGAPVNFADGTRGGWDECLPSISACVDPNRREMHIADHGDFWAAPWSADQLSEDSATFTSDVPGHPLLVRKTVGLGAHRQHLTVAMEILNRTDEPYQFLYSAHPLWSFEYDVVIDLPDAGDVATGFGSPDIRVPVSRIGRLGERTNYKAFVRWSGTARYAVPALESTLLLRQTPEVLPWLGICVNRGAYPAESIGDHWIAMEPTTAPTDSLAVAVQSGTATVLEPNASLRWTTDVEIVHGEAMYR